MALDRVDITLTNEQDPLFQASPAADITQDDIANIQAIGDVTDNRLLGRGNGSGDGAAEEIIIGANLSLIGNTLDAASAGEANTASNVNVGGVGVFKQKTGVDLEFKGVNAASNKVSVTEDAANNEIDIDVNEGNLTVTASQVSDFDTEVSNNTDVSANTAKVSADGSIDTHSDVDTSTSPPSVGEVLEWDGSNWVPATPGTESALPIISLTSTDTTTTINQSTPQVLSWDVEREKDSAFTHSNTVNNSRITIADDGTYQIAANIRLESSAQRLQAVSRILINGVLQSQPYGSSYIRNSGNASDFWTCSVNPPPVKLNSGDYVEIQTQVESQTTTTITGTFKGDESSFSAIQLKGFKGDKGDTGAGSNIVVQENDSTVGTVNSTLNFEGSNLSVTDEGSNKATVAVDADKYYSQSWEIKHRNRPEPR